jgi:DNA repair photolyase
MDNPQEILLDISNRFSHLKKNSNYSTEFDISIYETLYKRLINKSGSFVHQNVFELINTYTGCQQCHQAFQIDTYGKGCTHDCIYCFAKNYAEQKNEWNNPMPIPMDISEVWEAFYKTFETNEEHAWREILIKKTPIRLGANSDCFMSMDRKFGITKEFLKILNHYNYPYLIVTRSDLIAKQEYLSLLNKDLAAIHISIPSLNEELTKKIEPHAPSPKKRLETIRTLTQSGFWVTARVNPLIPCHPDGYFTKGVGGDAPNFFNFDLISEIGKAGAQSLLAGVITMPKNVIDKMSQALSFDLSKLTSNKSGKFQYTGLEVQEYYKKIKSICSEYNVQFTTCYLGSGEPAYSQFKHLWDNQEDCCNAKNRVKAHKIDSREISLGERSDYISEDQGYIQSLITKACIKLMGYIFKGLNGK